MKQRSDVLSVSTRRGLVEITTAVREVVRAAGVREGLCTVFVRHTSASLVSRRTPTHGAAATSRPSCPASSPTATRSSPTTRRVPTTCPPTSRRRCSRLGADPGARRRSGPRHLAGPLRVGAPRAARTGARWSCTCSANDSGRRHGRSTSGRPRARPRRPRRARARPSRDRGRDLRRGRGLGRRPPRPARRARGARRLRGGRLLEQPEDDPRRAAAPAAPRPREPSRVGARAPAPAPDRPRARAAAGLPRARVGHGPRVAPPSARVSPSTTS